MAGYQRSGLRDFFKGDVKQYGHPPYPAAPSTFAPIKMVGREEGGESSLEQVTNYQLVLQYDGTRYEGWQKQKKSSMTIQGKLEAVLEAFAGTSVEVNGSGRTDAGVHALGQTASVKLPSALDGETILPYLNRYLPEDIRILSVKPVSDSFHARLSAVRKTYVYRVDTRSKKDVFERKYVYGFPFALDIKAMERASKDLLGTHDFKSFCGNKKMKKSTIRTLEKIYIQESDGRIKISYTGNGFLQYMVRILTGTLLEVGLGRRRPESVPEILLARERSAAGFMAPPEGLFLVSVEYKY